MFCLVAFFFKTAPHFSFEVVVVSIIIVHTCAILKMLHLENFCFRLIICSDASALINAYCKCQSGLLDSLTNRLPRINSDLARN